MADEAWVRERSCSSKTRYTTLKSAERVAKKTPKKARRRAGAYKCRFCEWFHVGHNYSGRTFDSNRSLKMRLK